MASRRKLITLFAVLVFCAAVVALISCGGNSNMSGGGGMGMGAITTNISDPGTCATPTGPFSHVFVTVTDVKGSTNGNAGDNDSSFVDFTPNMTPTQVDLLGAATQGCFLAQLGSGVSIPAGTYEQIRIILADNSTGSSIANNQCGSGAANCVVLASDSSVHTLNLSSESKTGIKIPSSQVSGGGLNVPSGQTADLDIDFNACASIVQEGNGQFRLKPVLHAGEVSLTQSTAISGTAVDKATSLAPVGGATIAALELKDPGGVDRIFQETAAAANGNFTFCPVPAGTYDVVVIAIDGNGVQYAATVTTGVMPGDSLGNVPLIAQPTGFTAPGTITGLAATAGMGGGVSTDVVISALQSVGGVLTTIPLASISAGGVSITTAASGTCAAGSNCATYSMAVPATNPNVGAFSSGGTTYSQAAGSPTYVIDGQAFALSPPGTTDCSQGDVQVNMRSGGGAITVTSGTAVTAADVMFSGCA